MRLLYIIPITKIPSGQPQILSYFSGSDLLPGTVVQIPLGRRREKGVVVKSEPLAQQKLAIKQAAFELKNISRVISPAPLFTPQQIELALFLGQYYFASPGLFLKMMLPKKGPRAPASQPRRDSVADGSPELGRGRTKGKGQSNNVKIKIYKSQKLILTPTQTATSSIAANYPDESTIIWHSNLSKKQLSEIWHRIKNRQIQTIVGTRSAVFLPFANLKEIIVEDATNPNHKSWDMFPHYRVHEVAQKLSELFDAKLVLKSLSQSPKIKIVVVDMRQEIKNGNFSIFSQALQEAIKNTLACKKQIILFINRRGTANFVLCRDCGYVAECQNCDAPLAYHLMNVKPTLLCHRCGYKEAPPGLCPKCQSYRVKTVGTGTQKVALEAAKLFPEAKILRLDSDAAPQVKDQQKIIDAFVKKEADILVTTQILFSWLQAIKQTRPAMVAIISADTLLHLPDFRSGERTFQTIAALQNLLLPRRNYSSSEASKFLLSKNFDAESRSNENLPPCFIQTYNTENSVIKYAAKNDWASFVKEDLKTRQALKYPPFSQIVKLTFRHRDPKKTGAGAKILAAKLKQADKNNLAEISDALPAFIPKEKGSYIWHIILKFPIAEHRLPMNSEFLRRRNSLLQYVPPSWRIDVDPEDLL